MSILPKGNNPGLQQRERHGLGVRALSRDDLARRLTEAANSRDAVHENLGHQATGTATLVILFNYDRKAGDGFVRAVGNRRWI